MGVRERIYLGSKELHEMEQDILNRRHVERYAMVRQWCNGRVLDISCGCGYGTFLLSKNPDVKKIKGVDISESAISWAEKYFRNDNLSFEVGDINTFQEEADVLISLETIEHLRNPDILAEMANRCNIQEIFVSYPSKKTTHYNPYHFHDFCDSDLIRIFNLYELVDCIDLHREVRLLKFKKK